MLNIPLSLTYLRLALIPVFVYLPFSGLENGHIYAAVVFAVASATDWLDGYLARRWNETTAWGAFLDPVADKVIVSVALVILAVEYASLLITLGIIVIISREIIISSLREWMSKMNMGDAVSVAFIGKLKTAIQMSTITYMLYFFDRSQEADIQCVTYTLIGASAAISVASMYSYLKKAIVSLQRDQQAG